MKILHVADIHHHAGWMRWISENAPRFDIVALAGDLQDAFSPMGMHAQAKTLSSWITSLPTLTVVCSGNHDFWAGDARATRDVYAEAGWIRMLRGRGKVLAVDGDVIEHRGVRIAVNGWLKTPKSSAVDILVTHAPPAGTSCSIGAEGHDVGDLEIEVSGINPWLILSGHVHQPSSLWCRWRDSLVLVPGRDETSGIPPYWIVDTVEKSAVHSIGVG